MKSILLPTDFSKNSINAIHFAVNLFKSEECDFHILNVQKASAFISDDLMTVSSSATIYQTLIETAKKSIDNLIFDLRKKHNNDKHRFHSSVDYDNFIDAINQMCETYKVDLIVMGTKGASGVERIMFGSNTVHVMQRSDTAVLAIPDQCKFSNVNLITFLSDYLSVYKKNDLKALLDIAKLFEAKIDVCHVVKESNLSQTQKINKAYMDECFRTITHEFVEVEGESIYDTVLEFITKNNVKMLAMMNRKHSFFERLFTRHNVETFGFNIKIPFLVMEESKA